VCVIVVVVARLRKRRFEVVRLHQVLSQKLEMRFQQRVARRRRVVFVSTATTTNETAGRDRATRGTQDAVARVGRAARTQGSTVAGYAIENHNE
jgi:hypothetical protein